MPDGLNASTLATLSRYFLTAGVAAIVDLGGFAGLVWHGYSVFWSAIASFMLANIVNYTLSARFAFATIPTWQRYPVFFAASILGLSVNVTTTTLIVWGFDGHPVAAKTIGIGVAFFINFALNAKIVFPHRK